MLLCVLATLISGSETKLLPDQLRWLDGACCPDETTSPRHLHYTHLSAVKRTRGHISHFGQKKRQLPIILSGLDSPHLLGWCRRLVANRQTSRLTLLCALDSLLEHSCLSTTTRLYSML